MPTVVADRPLVLASVAGAVLTGAAACSTVVADISLEPFSGLLFRAHGCGRQTPRASLSGRDRAHWRCRLLQTSAGRSQTSSLGNSAGASVAGASEIAAFEFSLTIFLTTMFTIFLPQSQNLVSLCDCVLCSQTQQCNTRVKILLRYRKSTCE